MIWAYRLRIVSSGGQGRCETVVFAIRPSNRKFAGLRAPFSLSFGFVHLLCVEMIDVWIVAPSLILILPTTLFRPICIALLDAEDFVHHLTDSGFEVVG